jgi:phosphomannomutase/phosphoglucomutase
VPFRNALVKGLSATGIEIVDVGCVPTPLLYYAIHELKRSGGVMITGSHNPADHNGFKICLGNASVYGAQIQEIADIIEAMKFSKGAGGVTVADVITPYKKYVRSLIKPSRRVRVAMDCGNGTACLLAPDIAEALGCEVTRLYCDMDGEFPNHHPDPTIVENLADLRSAVTSKGLELGISFDGDADRIGVIADDGRIVWGDTLLAIYAREILKRKPGSTFIAEVKCSVNLYEDIEKHGGRPIMWKTGHSLIKAKMREEKAELAGEMSGHMFFADRYLGYDDGIYAACRIIELLADSPIPLSEILDSFPATFSTPEIRLQCDDDKKFLVVEKVKEYFKKDCKVIDVDGARVVFPDGWGLIRASNTQDVLVMRFEAKTEARLDEIRAMVEKKAAEVRNGL